MSASQQKKVRQELRSQGADKRQIAQQKAEKAAKKANHTKATVWIIVLLILVCVVGYYSNALYIYFPAVRAGDVSYSAAEYSFYYNYTVNSYLNQYSQYLSQLGLDTSKPYSEQTYPDGSGKTWAEHFKESAEDTMKNTAAYYSAAKAEGFKLSDSDQATLETNLENARNSYKSSKYNSADAYFSAQYGTGVTEKLIEDIFTKGAISSAYVTQKQDSYKYSSGDLDKYYSDNKADLDSFSYIAYLVDGSVKGSSSDSSSKAASASPAASASATASDIASPSPSADATAGKEAAMAAAKTTADGIVAAAKTQDAFIAAVKSLANASASVSSTQGAKLTDAYASWVKDSSRKAGDTTVISTDSGYYALYFVSHEEADYSTVNVRHILIKAVASSDGTYTDDAKATAKQKADDLLAQWKSGDATEDSFAALATKNTDDTGSKTKGGLYENIYKGQMVTNFNDWCFDASRKTGDTGIVFNQDSNYCGYHVIYFVGKGETYHEKLADDAKKDADFSAWQKDLLSKYEIKKAFCAFLLKKIG